MIRVVTVGLAFLVAATASAAGPAPIRRGHDRAPQWSANGTQLAFTREQGNYFDRLLVVNADGSGERELAAEEQTRFFLSPDWRWIALVQYGSRFSVLGPSDSEPVFVMKSDRIFGAIWSADSRRVVSWNGRGAPLPYSEYDVVARTLRDVSGYPSPAGGRYASLQCPAACHLVVADADGSSAIVLARNVQIAGGRSLAPWSPDGSRLAYGTRIGRSWAVGVVAADGTGRVEYPIGSYGPYAITWGPGPEDVTLDGYAILDLRTGSRTPLPDGWDSQWSPGGERLAFVAGEECEYNSGIYTARRGEEKGHRLTNSCRILGTAGNDVLTGTDDRDLLYGYDGADRLSADQTANGYSDDDLHGGAGNDTLVGGVGPDLIFGDEGNDTIRGEVGPDVLVGGPGRDEINAGRGRDIVSVRDGERDWVSCGENAEAAPAKTPDVVFADRRDYVAPDCEKVFRG